MLALNVLNKYFGYDVFRKGQQPLIDDILAGKDVLGIMPTGAGKSLCFQVPAIIMDGVTLIISPLISLMKDQVSALCQAGIPAAYINSSLNERQISRALQNARNGDYKLIYVAPERLITPDFIQLARSVHVSMLTVDEAHCISQWGQDFRPSYAKIPDFIDALDHRPIVSAFTATATQIVREDIVKLLQLVNPTVLVTGFDRKNLYFEVQKPKDKFSALTSILKTKREQSGIIYCSTRATVEEVCDMLRAHGYNSSRYHAGLSDAERHNNQDDFLYDRVQIMVATNAFGMGIDKSNVSYVIHYNMPKDIESYYQEAGRAGREGQPADCIMLYSGKDVRTNLWLIENARDVTYADKEVEEMLKERDRKRLKEMTFYCTTSECLRAYILKYFGENPPNFCGNCNCCNTNFETVDITEETQKVLSCVVRLKRSFGANTIIDVLTGSKNEKVLRLGLNHLSTYGISTRSAKQLRDIINFLILEGYLVKTDDKYPIIKLGPLAENVLRGLSTVEMKLSHIDQTAERADTNDSPVTMNKQLFATLKELRLAIAGEQNVPAFVVFADTTLLEMCSALPTTEQQMLKISGVGQVKLERYGKRFIDAITEFLSKDVNLNESPPAQDEFQIEISDEPITISAIADRINFVNMQIGKSKVSGQKINNWLVSTGHMEIITNNGNNRKIPTKLGSDLQIINVQREICGELVRTNLYGKPAQQFIVQNLSKIIS